MQRSPSFSRFLSSIRMTMRPRRISSIASSIVAIAMKRYSIGGGAQVQPRGPRRFLLHEAAEKIFIIGPVPRPDAHGLADEMAVAVDEIGERQTESAVLLA